MYSKDIYIFRRSPLVRLVHLWVELYFYISGICIVTAPELTREVRSPHFVCSSLFTVLIEAVGYAWVLHDQCVRTHHYCGFSVWWLWLIASAVKISNLINTWIRHKHKYCNSCIYCLFWIYVVWRIMFVAIPSTYCRERETRRAVKQD